jgi:hypothetical protein
LIVEGFDNAWHVLRGWAEEGYEFFAVESRGRVPEPSPLRRDEISAAGVAGRDYFPIPTLAPSIAGDNPDPERALTPAEILLAAAIAEGWERDQD